MTIYFAVIFLGRSSKQEVACELFVERYIVQVGGCDSNGICGVSLSQGPIFIKMKYPVPYQDITECYRLDEHNDATDFKYYNKTWDRVDIIN